MVAKRVMKSKGLSILLAVSLLVLLAAVACGDEDETSASTPLPAPSGSEEASESDKTSESGEDSGSTYPSIKPSSIEVGGRSGYTTIQYGAVPEDFLPEIPDLETLETFGLVINLEKSMVGSLTSLVIEPFRVQTAPFVLGFDDEGLPEDIQSIIEADYTAVFDEGATLMICKYQLLSGRRSLHRFWLGSAPSAADPDRLSDRLPEHPLLKVSGARSQCPASDPGSGLAFMFVSGNWDPLQRRRESEYLHFAYDRTTDNGLTDIYDFFWYNTSRGVPVKGAEGTLTVDADGKGYLEFATPSVPGFEAQLCRYKAGGEVAFSAVGEELQVSISLDCLSQSGEITGGGLLDLSWQRR